jgi:hypothetical protein
MQAEIAAPKTLGAAAFREKSLKQALKQAVERLFKNFLAQIPEAFGASPQWAHRCSRRVSFAG